MQKSLTLMILCFSLISVFCFSTYVRANSTEIPFEVAPIIPDFQTKKAGYFEFNVSANFHNTIAIKAKNLKNSPVTLHVAPFNASTSTYGEILYDVNAKRDKFVNLEIPLSQFILNEKTITIPANTIVDIPLEINLPDINKGLVLGGIHVIAEDETIGEQEIKQGESTFQIKNQIAYVIGLKMQLPTPVDPEFSFGKVKVDMQYGIPKVFLEMKNSAPAIVKDLSGTYAVYNKKGKTMLEGSFSKMKMAPNTRFEYAIDWKEGKVEPGKYSVKLTGTADGEKVSAERDFVIKDTTPIKDYNKETKNTAHVATLPWWNYLIIVLVVGFIFFIIGRKSKKKKKYQRQKFDFLE